MVIGYGAASYLTVLLSVGVIFGFWPIIFIAYNNSNRKKGKSVCDSLLRVIQHLVNIQHAASLASQEHCRKALQINILGVRISFTQPAPFHQNTPHARQSSSRARASEPARLLGVLIWKPSGSVGLHGREERCWDLPLFCAATPSYQAPPKHATGRDPAPQS